MSVWYREGLSFECTACGNCCTGAPGVVWVDAEERRRIAERLSMHPDDLWGPILRRVGRKVSLTERSNGDCVFLRQIDDGRRICTIYDDRPQQCRTWPFWPSNLRSRRSWDRAAGDTPCPGMNHGRQYDYIQIEAIRTAAPWYDKPEGHRDEAAQ